MADAASRIEQFRKMANDDPKNELGHFSLGRALLDDKQYEQAAQSLRKCLELNPNISKAYQLLGAALLSLNGKDEAIQILTDGAKRADERREVMPRNDMTKMLKELGAPVPEFKQTVTTQAAGEGEVLCQPPRSNPQARHQGRRHDTQRPA